MYLFPWNWIGYCSTWMNGVVILYTSDWLVAGPDSDHFPCSVPVHSCCLLEEVPDSCSGSLTQFTKACGSVWALFTYERTYLLAYWLTGARYWPTYSPVDTLSVAIKSLNVSISMAVCCDGFLLVISLLWGGVPSITVPDGVPHFIKQDILHWHPANCENISLLSWG